VRPIKKNQDQHKKFLLVVSVLIQSWVPVLRVQSAIPYIDIKRFSLTPCQLKFLTFYLLFCLEQQHGDHATFRDGKNAPQFYKLLQIV